MSTIITSALPYANGAMHLGHVRSTYIPADIYARYLRLRGDDVIFVCGTDEHGTPIGLRAEKEGISPQKAAERFHKEIDKDLKGIGISFDVFSGTNSSVHERNAQEFYNKLKEADYIYEKPVKQLFCSKCKRFLPDRYVEGICAFCGKHARGDHCESCGRHLDLGELKEVKCTLCGTAPEIQETEHYFFKLSKFADFLKQWIPSNAGISSNARNYAKQWLSELKDWDITRESGPGVKIPGTDKFFYVWFDAPIAYLSFTQELTEQWKDYWTSDIIHFIGKDIIYHHTLFWPAMLKAEGSLALPKAIQAGGFLTLEGEKMSTSRNHVVWISDYLKAFPADYLRFYLISAAAIEQDIDFSWANFMEKVNSELIDNFGNFANRILSFCDRNFEGKVPEPGRMKADSTALMDKCKKCKESVEKNLSKFDFMSALREILVLSSAGNEFFQSREPWKSGDSEDTVYYCINVLADLVALLQPYIPDSCNTLADQLGVKELSWENIATQSLKPGHIIGKPQPIFKKIDQKDVDEQVSKLGLEDNDNVNLIKMDEITIDDFAKVKLKVAEIKEAKDHPNAEKLLVLKVDAGDEDRQVVAGIKAYYQKEELIGKKIIILSNLKPAKLRGEESQGMILAAEKDGKLALLTVDKELPNGALVG
jgi:methionyl-tRNA synthetase